MSIKDWHNHNLSLKALEGAYKTGGVIVPLGINPLPSPIQSLVTDGYLVPRSDVTEVAAFDLTEEGRAELERIIALKSGKC